MIPNRYPTLDHDLDDTARNFISDHFARRALPHRY
jgi:hypothetical protein